MLSGYAYSITQVKRANAFHRINTAESKTGGILSYFKDLSNKYSINPSLPQEKIFVNQPCFFMKNPKKAISPGTYAETSSLIYWVNMERKEKNRYQTVRIEKIKYGTLSIHYRKIRGPMEKNTKILLVVGGIIIIFLLFISIYLAGIAAVILIALVMTLLIMQDTSGVPEIVAKFSEDGKAIILTNSGNARAKKIHVALVPGPFESDISELDVDSVHTIQLPAMLEGVKILLTYTNDEQRGFSRSQKLSLLGEEPDLLKPMIPIFKWK